jgi:hypothetical protein
MIEPVTQNFDRFYVVMAVVCAVIRDWRTRGRLHAAWVLGAAALTADILLRRTIAGTHTWLAIPAA